MRHKWFVMVGFLLMSTPSWGLDRGAVESAITRLGLTGRYSVSVVSDNRPNAGAYPDGRIVVTSGMLDFVRSEDELAAVLAHERTHVDQRHAARQGKEFLLTALLTYGIAKVAGASGDLATGAAVGAGVARWQRFSLRDEYRADEGSVKLLASAGYQPDAIAGLFERLKSQPPVDSGKGESLCFLNVRTHPSFNARIKAVNKVPFERQQLTARREDITLFVERINLSGYGYSDPEHVHQLMLTELRKHVRVFERQTPEVRYKAVLSANIAIGWSGGSRGVFLPDLGVQVSSGRSRAHGEFTGTVVDLQSAEVVGGVTTPRHGTSKTNTGLFVQAGRLSPISIQSHSAGNMEQILLQRLVREGIGAWVAALVKTVEPAPVAASQPAGLATYGVEPQKAAEDFFFDLDPVASAYTVPGETWGIYEDGQRIGTVRVRRVEGRRVYCDLVNGRIGGPRSYTRPDN